MEGIVVVDKPSGMTSHDVVDRARKIFGIRRIGHAGTLDPLATGVLILLVGKATKLSNRFITFDKAYDATLKLGVKTTTADIEGEVLSENSYEHITSDGFCEALKKFSGEIDQVPPMVSAVKVNGQRLYKLARKGVEVKREPRRITIYDLKMVDFTLPLVKICVECSKGTYVRQLAEDIGSTLGCDACISQIRRTKVGPFLIENAVKLEQVNETVLQNWSGDS